MQGILALLVWCLAASPIGAPSQALGETDGPVATIVVLPFVNRSQVELDWVGEGLAERLSETLACHGFMVADRDARLKAHERLSLPVAARLSRGSLIKVAEELDAAIAVSGEYDLLPGQGLNRPGVAATIRLEAFCLDLRRLQMENCGAEQGPLTSFSELQTRLAWQVLRKLSRDSAPALDEFLRANPPVRLDALEHYVRGLLADNPEQRHRHLAQSARLAPEFSLPAFELGRMHFDARQYRPAAGWLEKVQPGSSRYWRAQFLLGLCRHHTAEFTTAENVFARLAEHLPLNEVLNNLAVVRTRLNRPDVLDTFLKALEGDPDDPDYNFNVAYTLWKRGQLAQAAEYFRRVLELDPEDNEAADLLKRCRQGQAARAADLQRVGRERVKLNFDEQAWRELSTRLNNSSQ